MKNIVHFNVDNNLKPFLIGEKVSFALNEKNLSKIIDKNKIEIISFNSRSVINCEVIKHFPKLKLIISRTVGVNHIDFAVCKKRGIIVKNIPDYGSHNIAELAMMFILLSARNVVNADKEVHKGKFSYEQFMGLSLKNKILGVIGTGRIGLELIKIASVFGLKIIAYDIKKNNPAAINLNFSYVSFETLLKTADFISLHVLLNHQTKYLIGTNEIKQMKDNVILINTSRGGIIDTKALIKNIKKFKAACLDVLEDEDKFTEKHPLLKYDNVIITPHIGFYTDQSVKKIAQITMQYVEEFKK